MTDAPIPLDPEEDHCAFCGVETAIRCHTCNQPACARCTEPSWEEEAPETCPTCWEKLE